MTEEGKVKEQVKKLLKAFGVYYHMPVQNGFGKMSLDFVACHRGFFIAIETKALGKKPTPRQLQTMAEMEAAGAFVFLVSCEAELAIVRAYLELLN